MVVRLRLARFGKKHAPVYNIVVAQARSAQTRRPLEVLGTYDPIPRPPPHGDGKPIKDIQLDISRTKYWLGVGAQPSDTVWRILSMVGLLEPKWGVERVRRLVNPVVGGTKVPVREGGGKKVKVVVGGEEKK